MQRLRLRTSKTKAPDDEAKRLFGFQLRLCGVLSGIEEEYPFADAEGRRFRFDFALPALALGIEINGGIWTRGAHGHPADILRNMEKTNLAAALGWRVLAFSPEQVKAGSALAFTLATTERLGRLLCPNATNGPTLNPIASASDGVSSMPFLTRLPALAGVRRRKAGWRSYASSSSSNASSSSVTGRIGSKPGSSTASSRSSHTGADHHGSETTRK